MTQPGPTVDAHSVADELMRLCRKLIMRVVGSADESKIQTLIRFAKDGFGTEWDLDPVGTLELMLGRAISKLDGKFGKITRQEAALGLFNLDGGQKFPRFKKLTLAQIEGVKGESQKFYDYLYERVVNLSGLEKSSGLRDKIDALRVGIAEILIQSHQVPTQPLKQDPLPGASITDSTPSDVSAVALTGQAPWPSQPTATHEYPRESDAANEPDLVPAQAGRQKRPIRAFFARNRTRKLGIPVLAGWCSFWIS